jgi:hypothetical protein
MHQALGIHDACIKGGFEVGINHQVVVSNQSWIETRPRATSKKFSQKDNPQSYEAISTRVYHMDQTGHKSCTFLVSE